MRTALLVLLSVSSAAGCDGASSPVATPDPSVGPEGVVETSLSLDDGATATGGAWLREIETMTGDDCVAGVSLMADSASGIHPVEPAFVDRAAGTASRILAPVLLTWSSSDPDAEGGEVTDQWSGTFEVSEWSNARVVLLLRDGEHCAYTDSTTCAPASGTLTFDGVRAGPDAANPYDAMYEDVATGDRICSVDITPAG
jgi:hypothetical protein